MSTVREASVFDSISPTLLKLLKLSDLYNKATFKFVFLTLWGIIAGSAIGFQYILDDVTGVTGTDIDGNLSQGYLNAVAEFIENYY